MCGRYSDAKQMRLWSLLFGVAVPDDWLERKRYSIAPTNKAAVLRQKPEGGRQIDFLRWGLVPSWSKELKGPPLINARSETVHEKPSFRTAFARRRCLVLADGWYEWIEGNDGKKKPFRFVQAEDRPFTIAGLWEGWKQPDGEWLHSFAMVTCTNQDEHGHIHDRAPVTLVDPPDWDAWLDPATPAEQLKSMLHVHGRFRAYRVTDALNNVKTVVDGPELIEPAA